MRILWGILFLFLLMSCKTTRYTFIQEYRGEGKARLIRKLTSNPVFPKQGEITGIYIEKKGSYNFVLHYSIEKPLFDLKFFSLTGKNLELHCRFEKGIMTYPHLGDSYLTGSAGKLFECFKYAVMVYPSGDSVFRTKENYYIITEGKNYYKYDQSYLVKKENKRYTVHYRYTDDWRLDTITLTDSYSQGLLQIKSIGDI